MRNWSEVGKLTSMHVERLLALIKRSVEAKRPPAERVCSSGALTQRHAEHIAAGGREAKVLDLEDLLNAGAPLNANRAHVAKPLEGRVHIEYMNEKYTERKRVRGRPFSNQEKLDLRRYLCGEFLTMPRAEQQ